MVNPEVRSIVGFSYTRRQFLVGSSVALSGLIAPTGVSHAATSPIRAALIGCGRRGRWHAERIVNNPDCELAAVCDPLPDAVDGYGVPHLEWAAILDRRDIDYVVLALPEALRVSHVVDALRAGKHVVSESPIAMTARDCSMLDDAMRQFDGTFTPVCHSPFAPHWAMAAPLIESGAVGEIRRVQSQLRCAAFPVGAGASGGAWRKRREQSLGVAAEALHHELVAMAGVVDLGPESLVSCAGGRFDTHREQADAMLAEFVARNGARVVVSVNPNADRDYVHIRGDAGELTFGDGPIRIRRGAEENVLPVDGGGGSQRLGKALWKKDIKDTNDIEDAYVAGSSATSLVPCSTGSVLDSGGLRGGNQTELPSLSLYQFTPRRRSFEPGSPGRLVVASVGRLDVQIN